MIVLVSSCSSSVNEELGQFRHKTIMFPESGLLKKYYSPDSVKHSTVKLVKYISGDDCTSCMLNAMIHEEKLNRSTDLYSMLEEVYVISVTKAFLDKIESKLYMGRTEACVYIDTCNAFLSANPQIPDNEMFHTFVINNEGKVLMVGNPFQNEKMEALFKKVIANERKKQKSKKSA